MGRKSAAEVRRNMSAIRSRDNKAERLLGHCLHRLGFRYRKYARALPGRPDFVFPGERVVVFVDGDYWHARMLREQGEVAMQRYFAGSPRKDYWTHKFRRRIQIDDDTTRTLRQGGWVVLRFWESELRRSPDRAVQRIASTLYAVRGDREAFDAWADEPAEP